MANLAESIQRKFDEINADEIPLECKLKPALRRGVRVFSTQVIAMDNQNIVTAGDTSKIQWVFEGLRELDVSSNKIKSWSEVFTIIECSPRLEVLNLGYNPLHASPLFCEANGHTKESYALASSSQGSTCSAVDADLNSNQELDFSELSFQEPNDEEENNVNEISLADSLMSFSPSDRFISPKLTTLVLNSTYVPWSRILMLLTYLPSLNTLHAALNDFDRCCENSSMSSNILSCDGDGGSIFPQLTHLFFSENRIADWSAVCCLGRHFPGLQHLVLLGNPLYAVGKPDKKLSKSCFENLTDLNLTETELISWDCIDAIVWWMPALLSLRLGKDLPLFKDLDTHIVRGEVISRISGLASYNGTPITDEEREKAERDFIRRYGQTDLDHRPSRYWQLETQHGKIEPLAMVDLSPKRSVRMCIRFGEEEKWHTFCLRKSIGKVKQEVCNLFKIENKDAKRVRLFYVDQGMVGACGPEELRYPARFLYTYHPEDGDGFELYLVASVPRKTNFRKAAAVNAATATAEI